jgi:hypothetical protein
MTNKMTDKMTEKMTDKMTDKTTDTLESNSQQPKIVKHARCRWIKKKREKIRLTGAFSRNGNRLKISYFFSSSSLAFLSKKPPWGITDRHHIFQTKGVPTKA